MNPRGRLLAAAWGPAVAWALLISVGSSLPLRTSGLPFHGADKAAHGVEYAVLGLLVARALRRTRPGLPRLRTALLAAAVGAAYGAADEFHQAFVPEREASLRDWAADVGGSLAGAGVLVLLSRRVKPAVTGAAGGS